MAFARPTAKLKASRGALVAVVLTVVAGAEVPPAGSGDYPPGYGPSPTLPTPSPPIGFRGPRVIGWPANKKPVAPAGFTVRVFASDLASPRWLLALPNGDVLVAQSSFTPEVFGSTPPGEVGEAALRAARLLRPSPNTITLLRDADGDGEAEVRQTLLSGLNHPFGMAWRDGWLYVAATDGLWRYRFMPGEMAIADAGRKILALPAGPMNQHWTRSLAINPEGTKLYVSVGSATDADEDGTDSRDPWRAAIVEADLAGDNARVFATGLRNATGLDWEPSSGTLWTTVNERDHLGPDLPPDFLTSVGDQGFYGWPFAYFGAHADPLHAGRSPDLVARAIEPDYGLGAHTSPLGLAFTRAGAFPEPFHSGAFVSQHGSMRRSTLEGYRVLFVPFENGKPHGPPVDFLTGFVADPESRAVYGRPLGLAWTPKGELLVADDAGDRVWVIAPASQRR